MANNLFMARLRAASGPAPAVLGQVVVEGVVMRAPGGFAVAVRRPTGEIVVRERPWQPWSASTPAWRWFGVRGIIASAEGAWAHARALVFAADQAGLNGPLACATLGLKAELQARQGAFLKQMFEVSFWAAVGGLMALVVMPDVLASTLAHMWGCTQGHAGLIYLVGGVSKLSLLGLYLWYLHRLPHMRRLMMYHGAEHKAVAACEAGVPLELSQVRRMPILYARSAVTWGLWTALLATSSGLLLFAVPEASLELHQRLAVGALRALLWVPAIGVAYELNHWTAARLHRPWMRALLAPGLWLQRLVVREPTDAMIEVALVALRAALSQSRRAQVCDCPPQRFGLPKLVSAGMRARVRGSGRRFGHCSAHAGVVAKTNLSQAPW